MKMGLVFLALIIAVFVSGCVQGPVSEEAGDSASINITKEKGVVNPPTNQIDQNSKFGTLEWEEMELRKQANLGIYWARPHPGNVIWDRIENPKGEYHWEELDRIVRTSQELGINLLLTIWPYAGWDQEICHSELPETPDPFQGILPRRKGIPCDWEAYEKFLVSLVERYDGDGENDMPGLLYPVKYWEIGNEPEMKEGNDVFFQGTPEDYFLFLKRSAEAIRKADKDAKILHAGIASSFEFSREFWEKVFSMEGVEKYFDIANVHDLQGSEDGNVGFVRDLLRERGIEKPVWVTEFSLRSGIDREGGSINWKEVDKRISKAIENGAEKIFFISLPPDPWGMKEFQGLVEKYNTQNNI